MKHTTHSLHFKCDNWCEFSGDNFKCVGNGRNYKQG